MPTVNSKENKIKVILSAAYDAVNSTNDFSTKANLYFSIIQTKSISGIFDYREELYVDIKYFIHNYILSIKDTQKKLGYDSLDVIKIRQAICMISSSKVQVRLFEFACLEFDKEGLIKYSSELRHYSKLIFIKALWNGNGILTKLKAFLSLLFYNIWSSIGVFILIFLISYFITLPLSSKDAAWFYISYDDYSSNLYFNHFLNMVGDVLSINDNTFCKPTGIIGILAIITYKAVVLLIVGGVISKYASNIFHFKITEYE